MRAIERYFNFVIRLESWAFLSWQSSGIRDCDLDKREVYKNKRLRRKI
jgi:hypothetical protein